MKNVTDFCETVETSVDLHLFISRVFLVSPLLIHFFIII